MENMRFVVMSYNYLSGNDRKLLCKLYQPFIGVEAANLFIYLHDQIAHDDIESDIIDHTKLLINLNIKSFEELQNIRERLEASALLETYKNEDLCIYFLKDVLKPVEFFDDLLLSTMLKQSIGTIEFENLQREFLVTRYDLNYFQNVSKSFDDVYTIDCFEESRYDKWWNSIKKTRPNLLKNYFDYETLLAQVEPMEVFEPVVLRSSKFYETMNSVCFCFGFNTDEIVSLLRSIVKPNKEFDEKAFIRQAKKLYDRKSKKENVVIKPIREVSKDKQIVKALESVNASTLVSARFGRGLVSSEIEIIETLHRKHNFSYGFLNVLIIYVMSNTNGTFPALNYFLKIGNEWARKGITTTEQALNYIEGNTETVKPTYQTKKKQVEDPQWLKDQLNKKEEKKETSKDSIKDLEDFFSN